MVKFLLFFLFLFVTPVFPVSARDIENNFESAGVGNDSCPKFISAFFKKTPPIHDLDKYSQWLAGFISRANQEIHGKKNVLPEGTPFHVFVAAVIDVCQKSPDMDVSQAAAIALSSFIEDSVDKPIEKEL